MIKFIKSLIPWIKKYQMYAREVYSYAGMLQMVAGDTKDMLEIMKDGKMTEEEARQVIIMIRALRERTAILESNLKTMFPSVETRRRNGDCD